MAKKSDKPYLWTVMVYLAGDNNLTEESVFSIMEMEAAESVKGIAVVAQFDPKASHIPSHRHVIKDTPLRKASPLRTKPSPAREKLAIGPIPIEAPTIGFPPDEPEGTPAPAANLRRPKQKPGEPNGEQEDGETDTGNPETLFDFISWTTERFPADRYMVVLAGHGAGTEDDFLLKDEHPTTSLSIPRLADVFRAVKESLKIKVDILGMDVCLMSMVEVCYQLDGLVDYLVASESFSPAAGWPYRQILERLNAKKKANNKKIASALVDEYIGFYSDYVMGGLSVDQSVLKMSSSRPLVDAVKNLTGLMKEWLDDTPFREAIILAHWEAQSYNGEMFVDLQDFCELLAKRYGDAADACNSVIGKIRAVVGTSCYTGVENQFSNGVSIYFPWSDVAPSYADLDFAKDAGWNDFLFAYVEKTRRLPRGFKPGGKNEELLAFGPDRPPASAGAGSGSERFRKSDDRKSDDRGKNPIHSMRNPPITIYKEGLSKCIEANPAFVERLEVFSKIRPRKKPR